ncbi:MAG: hypothetical protein B0D92_06140 [Spirochaeta sp. LUC14_002_19_P3]|nr:MAG: hypothetical protein B0D92_06140 [Spirochaeta sp. LUC14_002_19_P3]
MDEEIKESIEEILQMQKENEKRFRETDEQMKRTDERLERIGIQLGGLGNNIGSTTEEFFFRYFENKPELGGMKFDKVIRNIWEGAKEHEYDILLINGDSVALIEVKHRAHPARVKHIVQHKTERFRNYFAVFKDYKLYIGLATMSTNAELTKAAREAGIFLLTQKGDVLEVVNSSVKVF